MLLQLGEELACIARATVSLCSSISTCKGEHSVRDKH